MHFCQPYIFILLLYNHITVILYNKIILFCIGVITFYIELLNVTLKVKVCV